MNFLNTTLLMSAMIVLFMAVGQAIYGQNGAIIAFVFVSVLNFGSYWYCDKLVLMMQNAQPVTRADAPQLYHVVERLASSAGIPMPKIYRIPGKLPNAFATGRDPQHAVVAVTDCIVRTLTPDELEGVLSHELAHIRNRDILISALAATMAGGISVMVRMVFWGFSGRDSNPLALLFTFIFAPIAAFMIRLGISRSREYEADAYGARLCGKPLALASALSKIEDMRNYHTLDVEPSFAHMYFANPLKSEGIQALFQTHPPTKSRIARLQVIAAEMIK